MNDFDGRFALVTGASQGLGAATARLIAERGAAGIVVTGRNRDRAEAVASGLPCPALAIPADLVDVAACRKVVAAAEAEFGRIDVLVNCAGATDRGRIETTTPELWDYVFAVNARAPFFLLQATVDVMRRHRTEGAIVNAISMTSHMGTPYLVPYAASKAALANLTRTAAYALLRDRIRVNGLNLGWTDTPGEHEIRRRWHGARDDSWLEEGAAEQPFGRLLQLDEVARAIAFLASPESGIMTGSVVDFDQTILCSGSLVDTEIVAPETFG